MRVELTGAGDDDQRMDDEHSNDRPSASTDVLPGPYFQPSTAERCAGKAQAFPRRQAP